MQNPYLLSISTVTTSNVNPHTFLTVSPPPPTYPNFPAAASASVPQSLLPGYFIVAVPTGEAVVRTVPAGGGHGLHYPHFERFILAQGASRHCHSSVYRRRRCTCRRPRYYRHAVCLVCRSYDTGVI
ncbi:hypothetical protein Zmor_007942 [Zophobas morio]|uniref:Uncharacterized protein n=1 Tax=Zophobas morio TaxID=2755281 RepID=A0AA38IWI3_9CUCU|nr:hypothetical protein Zmor_007942 [Zophobas morio]